MSFPETIWNLSQFNPRNYQQLQVKEATEDTPETLVIVEQGSWFLRFWKWLIGAQLREDARICEVVLRIFSENLSGIGRIPLFAFKNVEEIYFNQFPSQLERLQVIKRQALDKTKALENSPLETEKPVKMTPSLFERYDELQKGCGSEQKVKIKIGDNVFYVSYEGLNRSVVCKRWLEWRRQEFGYRIECDFSDVLEKYPSVSIATWMLYFNYCNNQEVVQQLTLGEFWASITLEIILDDPVWSQALSDVSVAQYRVTQDAYINHLVVEVKSRNYQLNSLFAKRIISYFAGLLNSGQYQYEDVFSTLPCNYLKEIGKLAIPYLVASYREQANHMLIKIMLLTASIETLEAIAKAIPAEEAPLFLQVREARAHYQIQANMSDQEIRDYLQSYSPTWG